VVLLPHSWEVPPTKITGALGLYEIFGKTSHDFSGAIPAIFSTTSNLGPISLIIKFFESANFFKEILSSIDNDLNEVITFKPASIAWTAYLIADPSAPIGNIITREFAEVPLKHSSKLPETVWPQNWVPCLLTSSSINPTASIPSRLENFSPPPPQPTTMNGFKSWSSLTEFTEYKNITPITYNL